MGLIGVPAMCSAMPHRAPSHSRRSSSSPDAARGGEIGMDHVDRTRVDQRPGSPPSGRCPRRCRPACGGSLICIDGGTATAPGPPARPGCTAPARASRMHEFDADMAEVIGGHRHFVPTTSRTLPTYATAAIPLGVSPILVNGCITVADSAASRSSGSPGSALRPRERAR